MTFTVTPLLLLFSYIPQLGRSERQGRDSEHSLPCSCRIRGHTSHMKNFKALYKNSVELEACTFVCECIVLDWYQRFGHTSCPHLL